jgi:hypothetical protein
MMPMPSRRGPVKYKKPSAFNFVSFALLAALAALAYAGVSFWPAYELRSKVKSELDDGLLRLYHANLRPEPTATQDVLALRRQLYDAARRAGVTDKQLEIQVTRNKQRVALEARFSSDVVLQGLGRRVTVHHAPHVETDSARVDW